MRYEDFKAAWSEALQASMLPRFGFPSETLDLKSMDRTYLVRVESLGGRYAEPFLATAELEWTWRASHTARTNTSEEDLLAELFDRDAPDAPDTERPWLRVDVTLHAKLPWGKPMPMPGTKVWARWVREVTERFEHIEPLVPEDIVGVNSQGMTTIRAWQGAPRAEVEFSAGGELLLAGVSLPSWQAVDLPRAWSDSGREQDEHPSEQLEALFLRLRASMHAWEEVLDHLLHPKR